MISEGFSKNIQHTVTNALAEDLGSGDLTALLINAEQCGEATVISREEAIICGKPWFDEVFLQLDNRVIVKWNCNDGDKVVANQLLCSLRGPLRALLTGERVALNFLQTLSGTATLARDYADALGTTPVRVLDTRKTVPGLRLAQKYAVKCGGCHNHRIGLYDGILIKENHIIAAGSITKALEKAKALRDMKVEKILVEVEVENLHEVEEALTAGADMVLLDNFDLEMMRQAVKLSQGRAKLEASGGVELADLSNIAQTGVDYISVGTLTKHVRAIDLSMRLTASGNE